MTKREQILITATRLFLELGFGSVSMDLVSREAKVSKATVYAHFSSKDELFLESLNYNRQQQQLIYPMLPNKAATSQQQLLEDIHNYLTLCFDYYINDIECNFTRLLIAELAKFPQLFDLFYAKDSTHITSNLEAYLINYFKTNNPQKIDQSYLIACQIIDMLRGQTIWVKLIKNPKREQFLTNKSQTVINLAQTALLIITTP